MSEEIIQTPLRNAAHHVADAAKLILQAVEHECLEMPVKFELPGSRVEVRNGYKPEDGWTITVSLDPRKE